MTEVIPTNNLYIVLLISLFTVILFTKLDSTCSQYTSIFYSFFFFYEAFFLFFSICYHIVYIHPSTTKYIYIFNLIVHASYFEAFFIIGLRLNSILFTPSCRTKCIQPKLCFFSSKCLFSLYFYRHRRLTHTRL